MQEGETCINKAEVCTWFNALVISCNFCVLILRDLQELPVTVYF